MRYYLTITEHFEALNIASEHEFLPTYNNTIYNDHCREQ